MFYRFVVTNKTTCKHPPKCDSNLSQMKATLCFSKHSYINRLWPHRVEGFDGTYQQSTEQTEQQLSSRPLWFVYS